MAHGPLLVASLSPASSCVGLLTALAFTFVCHGGNTSSWWGNGSSTATGVERRFCWKASSVHPVRTNVGFD